MIRWVLFAACSLQIALVDRYVLVEASIEERGPFLLLVDTGATSSAVTPAVAQAAGVRPDHRVTLSTATGDRVVPAGQTRVRVGDVSATEVEVLILELETMRRIDPRIQGVLGQSFLSRFPCLIDYRARRMWLGEEAMRRAEAMPAPLPAETTEGRMTVPVIVDGAAKPVRLVLDSGAAAMVLTCGASCPRLIESGAGGRMFTNAGEQEVVQGRVSGVTIGTIRIPRPAVALLKNAPLTPLEDGVIPAHWFSAVYLDPQRNQVRLAK